MGRKTPENSLVLRGNDLETAEHWLTLGPTKEPGPTELQTLYILEGRKIATNRRYRLLGGVMVGLVAIVILRRQRVWDAERHPGNRR